MSVRKSVRFSLCIEIAYVKHLNDFCPNEKDEIWYSKHDYHRIKQEILYQIQFREKNGIPMNDSGHEAIFTLRGLESTLGIGQRRQNQRESVVAVLNEQVLQRSEGRGQFPDVIAMLYNVLSFPCQQKAWEMGVTDAIYVYGTGEECRALGCKNALCERMPMDTDTVYVVDTVMQQLLGQQGQQCCMSKPTAFTSIEDWLFDRYQRGGRLANFQRYYFNDCARVY
jgi:hypothetical protein